MVKGFEPESILRRLQKRARQRVLHRDLDACIVCGSRERVEAAHVVAPPIDYFLGHVYQSDEQLKRDAAQFYGSTNMVLLCRKCHMLLDYPMLLQELAAKHGREKAAELITKALMDADVTLNEVKSGGHERVQRRVAERMFSLYGPGWKMIFEELNEAAKKKAE